MTELQRTELRLLGCFIEVCEKLKLKYYLVCGSALGAVKYGGFIPWDDDIDVALPREDYEIFCAHANEYLPEWAFVQNYRTDKAFPQIYTKLRDSRTAYIEKSVAKLPINHGVYIDIFPLDGYPCNNIAIKRLEFKKRLYQSILLSNCDIERGFKGKLTCFIYKLLGFNKNSFKIAEKFTSLISKYNCIDSEILANHGNWQGILEYASNKQYGNGINMKFEGFDVVVPERYDEYLSQKYGDWRSELPKDKQRGHHYYTVCDVNKSYVEYV